MKAFKIVYKTSKKGVPAYFGKHFKSMKSAKSFLGTRVGAKNLMIKGFHKKKQLF